jgi:DNA modification methylase
MAHKKDEGIEEILPLDKNETDLDTSPASTPIHSVNDGDDALPDKHDKGSSESTGASGSKAFTPNIVIRLIRDLKQNPRNARKHSTEQNNKVAASLGEFGCTVPVLIDKNEMIVAGHCRVTAAKLLGWEEIPTICLDHLTQSQIRAYAIADNQLGDLSEWDADILALEFEELNEIDLDFDLEVIGFETAKIDLFLEEANHRASQSTTNEEVELPGHDEPIVTLEGDQWCLGHHRLICGNALDSTSYTALMAGQKASMVFNDPPFNVPIDGHVCGLGTVNHSDFAMAFGEMTPEEYTTFLTRSFVYLVANSKPGSIHFICIDWRHLKEILAAGETVYTELKNLIVWVKTNGGMGTFYRSKHELILVFKNGKAPHINNFKLGETGRYRTNVWQYAGVNTFRKGRIEDLKAHPTVKPTEMVADAIRDCSKLGDIILDPFAGSGTTILAAERTKRHARCIEIAPKYVDVAIRRWKDLTGKDVTLKETGETFEEVELRRIAVETTPVSSSTSSSEGGFNE